MKRSTRDATRILRHTKSYAPKVFRRIPFPSEGSEGDIALGNTPSGIKLFASLGINGIHSRQINKHWMS